jgi:hypothetical protein
MESNSRSSGTMRQLHTTSSAACMTTLDEMVEASGQPMLHAANATVGYVSPISITLKACCLRQNTRLSTCVMVYADRSKAKTIGSRRQ